MTTPLSRFANRSPPGLDEWTISTVCRRFLPTGGSGTCHATGDELDLHDSHIYATLKRPTKGQHSKPEFQHFVFRDVDALEDWMENDGPDR